MGRARLLALSLWLAPLACGGAPAPVVPVAPGAPGASATAAPNVILISIDTLRADHVGAYGYGRDTTPFLDRFAATATLFERAFSPAPWTLIAHMTMLTGLYPTQHGVVGEELALDEEIPLLAERLHERGYRTVGLYRESWIHPRHGFARGFDVFRAHEEGEDAGAHLFEELGRGEHTRPLFLFLHLFDVHNGASRAGHDLLYPSPAPFEDEFLPADAAPLPALAPEELWKATGLLTPAQLATVVARYDGGIRHVDSLLEGWFERLEREGWLENTLVIVTSDHGESLGQRGTLDGHGGFAQEGLHVPLIVRDARGRLAGARVRETVQLGDLVPTILAAVGAPADARLAGRDLFEALPKERVVTGAYPPSDYVARWPEKIMRQGERCVAVDLERDPGELALRPVPSGRFDELLQQALPAGARFPAAHAIGPLPEAERAALRALGYGGEEER